MAPLDFFRVRRHLGHRALAERAAAHGQTNMARTKQSVREQKEREKRELRELRERQQRQQHVAEPDDLVCPITMVMFRDPVQLESGHTYERSAIVEHFGNSDRDPLTNMPVDTTYIRTNFAVRSTVERWLLENPGHLPHGWPNRELLAPTQPNRAIFDSGSPTAAVAEVQSDHDIIDSSYRIDWWVRRQCQGSFGFLYQAYVWNLNIQRCRVILDIFWYGLILIWNIVYSIRHLKKIFI